MSITHKIASLSVSLSLSFGLAGGSLLAASGCAPSHVLSNGEIPGATKLGDLMWSQATLADPAFKKSKNPTFTDADIAQFLAAAERIQLVAAKAKTSFSKGPAFDAAADVLSQHAGELATAANAKENQAISAALTSTRQACRDCHRQFK